MQGNHNFENHRKSYIRRPLAVRGSAPKVNAQVLGSSIFRVGRLCEFLVLEIVSLTAKLSLGFAAVPFQTAGAWDIPKKKKTTKQISKIWKNMSTKKYLKRNLYQKNKRHLYQKLLSRKVPTKSISLPKNPWRDNLYQKISEEKSQPKISEDEQSLPTKNYEKTFSTKLCFWRDNFWRYISTKITREIPTKKMQRNLYQNTKDISAKKNTSREISTKKSLERHFLPKESYETYLPTDPWRIIFNKQNFENMEVLNLPIFTVLGFSALKYPAVLCSAEGQAICGFSHGMLRGFSPQEYSSKCSKSSFFEQ